MADSDLYDTDILAWSERQARALRELATRRDLPNELDLAHVAEEIEDVGLYQLKAVNSFIRLILVHALKCVFVPDSLALRHWHAEIGNWQNELVDRVTPSMLRKVDMDVLWARAIQQTKLELVAQTDDRGKVALMVIKETGSACPITIDDLLPDAGEPVDLAARIDKVLNVGDT